MEEVREAIGIDKVDTSGNLIFIEEHHNTNANFILQAITSHCIEKNHVACFVLFHNTFGHLHNVGMKLGYDLRKACNSNVRVVEPFKILSKNIHKENSDQSELLKIDINSNNNDLVKQFVQVIRDEYSSSMKDVNQKVYIIIDDLSHLLDVGLNAQDVWLFLRYLRSFVNLEPLLTICITSHVYKATQELCQPNLIAIEMRYFAELLISTQPLETGYSKNVSGKMTICWKSHPERLKFKWPEETVYLYKLFDRRVKLFTPGSSLIM